MQKKNFLKRMMALILSMAMILGCLPQNVNAEPNISTQAEDSTIVTDPGTADKWEDIMGTAADGSRYAGRVWVDKSVYKKGDTVKLNQGGNADSSFKVTDLNVEEGEYFQVVFSALGSSLSTNTTITGSRPLDVVLVLDTSTSMAFLVDEDDDDSQRMRYMIPAANELLEQLLALGDVRVSIVTYNANSETVLPLAKYKDGVELKVNNYLNNGKAEAGVVYAYDKRNQLLGNDSGYEQGTNLQSGIDRGLSILAAADGTEGRTPVAIVLTDGEANRAVRNNWYDIANGSLRNRYDINDALALSTLLNAAYNKVRVEKNYGSDMMVYGIGVDLETNSEAHALMNPGDEEVGFNDNNDNRDIRDAYNSFLEWSQGENVVIEETWMYQNYKWTFDHNLPSSSGVTSAEVAENINYVDNYQSVSSANLEGAFESIVDELSSPAFNPITDSNNGATGVEETPLIYVDNIGQYMEVKNIQALQVFETTYEITKNTDGTYSVKPGFGENPTTDEKWNTEEDIEIKVIENADGTQQLRIYIHQEILPILLDKITVTTENGVTNRTLEETSYPPLRVYYTVGIKSDLLLANGQVDVTKLDNDYAHVNTEDGTVSFYSNAFGELNTTNTDGDEFVDEGDAHVGFVPSHENRFYYHQAHQEIFISATNKDRTDIDWEDEMYGVPWDEEKYELEALKHSDLDNIGDTDRVYTYVTFTRPKAGANNNEAEEVTYLVYTTWGALKSAATYYDKDNEVFLNDGAAIDPDQVDTVVGAYQTANPDVADNELIAVLGVQSRRVSRLSNMFETKNPNNTGTAETSYAPEYNDGAHEDDDIHEHSEVIVWLGNNGKLTLPVASGIQVTKKVTELADGALADEKFDIQVLLDMDYSDENVKLLSVTDVDGASLESSAYTITEKNGKILVTLKLAKDESAYILGTPGGTTFAVTEAAHTKYDYIYTGVTKTETGKIVEGVVTNAPKQPGGLYITKEVKHANGGEVFPTNQKFKFEVTFKDAEDKLIANKEFQLENNYEPTLTKLSTNENGVMTGQLRHGETVYIKGIPAGATVTVNEVDIPDNFTLDSYRSRNESGADTVENGENGEVTIMPQKDATVVVTNTYTPDPVDVNIEFTGTKNFDAKEMNEDSTFTFKLQKYNGNTWTDVENETVTINATTTNASELFAFTELNLNFTEPGVHSYQIVEVKGDNGDITYDRSVYTFSVNATLDSNGDLNAEVIGHNTKEGAFTVTKADNTYNVNTVFNNYYHQTATSIAIEKSIEDNANAGKTAAGFVVETYNATVENGVWIIGSKIRETKTDAQGEALLVRNYDNTDFDTLDTDGDNIVTYHFIIKEAEAGNTLNGWTYDATEYRVTVVLEKDTEGEISADFDVVKVDANGSTDLMVNGDTATITFNNTYDPTDVTVDLSTLVTKKLNGRDLEAEEFTFAIYKNGEAGQEGKTPVATGTNGADGKVTFSNPDKLTFSQVGKYEYDIVEVRDDKGGVTYDSTIYDLVVEVKDDNGELDVNYYFEDAVGQIVTFENDYTVEPTKVIIDGIKTLKVKSGTKTLKAGDYTFALYEGENKIDETTNLADGTFVFDAITYDAIGTHKYTVKEVIPDEAVDGVKDGVKYSSDVKDVTVVVSDNGDGTLSTEVTGNGKQNINFENEYTSNKVDVTLVGKKTLNNRELAEDEFTFALYNEAGNKIDETTNLADGNFEFEKITYNDIGTYHYTVKEVIPEEPAKGIHYSDVVYNVTVNVTDSGNGQLSAATTITSSGVVVSGMEFRNAYIPEPGEITVSGTKNYEGGKSLEDGMFEVGLYGLDDHGNDTLLDTAEVKADGSFTFRNLKYDAGDVGNTYIYEIKEIIDVNDEKHIYDETIYTLEVTVEDDTKDGVLEITKTFKKGNDEVEALTFTNTYIPDPIKYPIEAKKVYDKGLKGNDFEFKLTDADGKTNVNQTKKNDAEGKIVFDEITFNAAGEYKFKLTEKKEGIFDFIRPSQAEYEITITVVNENGVLRVSNVETVNTKNTGEDKDLLEFINTYVMDGEGEVALRGTKTLTGDRTQVEANEFEFGLYDAEGKLVESVKNDANGNFAFSTLKFDETDVPVNGQKQITYTVKEIAGSDSAVTYDKTVYTVVVTVKDNDQGGVAVSYTVDGKANGELAFVNEYHVADVVIGKTQSVNGGNATKDKIAVEAGDEVTYYITVNNSGTKVATGIVIEDEIEDGLILDESSISDNGSYSNGVITWNIDELAGADKDGNPGTVTVSFTVEIPEVDEETVWENVATVDYEENDDEPEPSNEVEAEEAVEEIEETIEPEEPKDGEGSTKTGDEARIITYLFALLASLIAAFVALIVRRRNSYRR